MVVGQLPKYIHSYNLLYLSKSIPSLFPGQLQILMCIKTIQTVPAFTFYMSEHLAVLCSHVLWFQAQAQTAGNPLFCMFSPPTHNSSRLFHSGFTPPAGVCNSNGPSRTWDKQMDLSPQHSQQGWEINAGPGSPFLSTKEPQGDHTSRQFATRFALPWWKAIPALFCWNAALPGCLDSPAHRSIHPLPSLTHTANPKSH